MTIKLKDERVFRLRFGVWFEVLEDKLGEYELSRPGFDFFIIDIKEVV